MNTAKIIIAISAIIIVYLFTNYPVIDETYSYFIVFLSFSAIIFAGARIYEGDKEKSYEQVETEMDKIYQQDGIFTYTEDGFYITRNHKIEEFKWAEIQKIYQFEIRMGRDSQSGLEIISNGKSFEINTNNSPGMEKFTMKINENLDIEDPSWTLRSPHNFDFTDNSKVRKKIVY